MADFIKFHKQEDLHSLQKQPVETLVEICKLSFDYIKNGPNPDKYQRLLTAQPDSFSVEQLQTSVEIIAQFLIDAVRTKAAEADFLSLADLGFSEDHISVLKQFVESKADNTLKLLKGQQQGGELRYRELDWRLEARVASRSLHSQAVPIITMKLHLDNEVEKRDVLNKTETQVALQTDPNSLVHIIGTLEQALMESKTHRTRNFVKAMNKA